MKKLNKYMLVVLNPRSTQEELLINSNGAYAAYLDASDATYAAYAAADAAYAAATYDTAYEAAYEAAETKKYIDKFFELSGHNIQDYYDENEKINKDK